MNNQIPQNSEYEKNLIGAFFYASDFKLQQDMFDRISAIVTVDDFYNQTSKSAFGAIKSLIESGVEIETVSFVNRLVQEFGVNEQAATNYASEVISSAPALANAEEYAHDIRQKAIARNLIDLTNRANQSAHDLTADPNGVIKNLRESLDLIEERHDSIDFMTAEAAVNNVIDEINEAAKNDSDLKQGALPTGFPILDKLTKGMQKDNLVIIGARPAAGKTAFALNLAKNVSKSIELGKKQVVVYNMEMSESSMMFRMLSDVSQVPMDKLQTGKNLTSSTSATGNDTNADWTKILNASSKIKNLNLSLNGTPGIRVSEIRSTLRVLDKELKARDGQEEGGVGMVIIDYLQLVEPEGDSRDGRQNEVAKISRSLKKLAIEMNIPIVALSQLSRGVEGRTEKRPMLSDLRDSGAIEQDADIVMFLYRQDYYDANGNSEGEEGFDRSSIPNESDVELIIAKNRQGANDTVHMVFKKDTQSYTPKASFKPAGGPGPQQGTPFNPAQQSQPQ